MRAETVFWSITLLYLLLALLSKFTFPELEKPGLLPLVYALAFLASIAMGFSISNRISEKVRGITYLSLFSAVLLATSPVIFLISLPMFFLLVFFVLCESNALLKKSLYALGVVLIILLPLLGVFLAGVPIIEPASRFSSFRFLYLASGYVTVVLLSTKPDWRVLLWGITISIISTFRTVVLGVVLAYTFGLLLERKRPRVCPLIAITLGLVLALIVRYQATLSSYPAWHLGIAESILYRPGVTYTVYERLFNLGLPLGRGWILLSGNPKLYIGHLFGRDVGYTYTLFGQPAYDLGLLGLFEGLILGMAFRDFTRTKETTVMGLTLLTLAVPIGLDAFFFSALMAIASIPTEVVYCRVRKLCR